jgi:hypothetical protein
MQLMHGGRGVQVIAATQAVPEVLLLAIVLLRLPGR